MLKICTSELKYKLTIIIENLIADVQMKGPIILTPYSSKSINDIGTSTFYTVITYQLVEMAH